MSNNPFTGKTKNISAAAPIELVNWLNSQGYSTVEVQPVSTIDNSTASHPDLRMCRLGYLDSSPVICATESELSELTGKYPRDIPFNAACTGKFFIHNLSYTNARLLDAARASGMSLVNVSQGYSKCSIVVVDDTSIITYDVGIAKSCSRFDLDVLLVEPGNIKLEGYSTGFIGGASGRIGNTICFCGNIDAHPNSVEIISFVKKRGLEIKQFDFPLIDIGSII